MKENAPIIEISHFLGGGFLEKGREDLDQADYHSISFSRVFASFFSSVRCLA